MSQADIFSDCVKYSLASHVMWISLRVRQSAFVAFNPMTRRRIFWRQFASMIDGLSVSMLISANNYINITVIRRFCSISSNAIRIAVIIESSRLTLVFFKRITIVPGNPLHIWVTLAEMV